MHCPANETYSSVARLFSVVSIPTLDGLCGWLTHLCLHTVHGCTLSQELGPSFMWVGMKAARDRISLKSSPFPITADGQSSLDETGSNMTPASTRFHLHEYGRGSGKIGTPLYYVMGNCRVIVGLLALDGISCGVLLLAFWIMLHRSLSLKLLKPSIPL